VFHAAKVSLTKATYSTSARSPVLPSTIGKDLSEVVGWFLTTGISATTTGLHSNLPPDFTSCPLSSIFITSKSALPKKTDSCFPSQALFSSDSTIPLTDTRCLPSRSASTQ